MNSIFQFIKFSIVGLSNTIVALGIYYFLLWLNVDYFIANIVSWVSSVFNAFFGIIDMCLRQKYIGLSL